MFFDSHAHYDDSRFDTDRHRVIGQVHESGASLILNAASDEASAIESVELAHMYDFIYAAVGIHPHSAGNMEDGCGIGGVIDADRKDGTSGDILQRLAGLATDPKVVAIGEIGLDYHYGDPPRDVQKRWFAKQVNLAVNLGLPVIVHDREAHEDCLEIVKRENARAVGGVFHCYSGSVEMAMELLKYNFRIGIGGSVTFKNARRIAEVVKAVPEEMLLVETDCPYLAPEPVRGRRNDSSMLVHIIAKIAELRGVSPEEASAFTMKNAKRLFLY